ncbi:MAG: radical SAM protein [Desulfurococcaceae archaeon]
MSSKYIGEVSYVLPRLRKGEEVYSLTLSVCPVCYRVLPAIIVERGGNVFIRKTCPEHGEFEELYYGDADFYKRVSSFIDEGRGSRHIYTPVTTTCPFNCGLCGMHKQHTALVNMVITNRCDLSCWYCFFYSEAAGYVYEPTLDQIRDMVRSIKKQGVTVAIQLTGGEPLLREDLLNIVKLLREEGVRHIQLNTNGLKFARLYFEDPVKAVEYARALRTSGLNTIYTSFDGVSPRTNPKNHWEIPFIFEVYKKSGITSVVLVPTVIKDYNTQELGSIIRFAAKNIDIVRAVNFQPVSLTGFMKRRERERYRITIPEVSKLIEEQTNGEIPREAWFPVNASTVFSRFVEAFSGEFKFEMSNHPICGVGTYIYVDRSGGDIRLVPITNFIDIEGLLEYFREKWDELITGSSRVITGLKLLYTIRRFIDLSKAPKEFDINKILLNIILKRSYEALGDLHYRLLFIGQMHFMDLYNYDIQRVQRCNIHYSVPDGRLIPFCAFNIFEDIYRDKIQREHGVSLEEFRERYKLVGTNVFEKHHRDIKKIENTELYKSTYNGFI